MVSFYLEREEIWEQNSVRLFLNNIYLKRNERISNETTGTFFQYIY